jgi:polyisoprenoid-binding protein YceI
MIKTVPNLPVVAPGTYRIDADASRIGFKTRHMFGLGPVKGTFALTTGEITIADVPESSSVQATVSAASFNTRNPLRDVQVRGPLFLNAKRHPQLRFRSSSVAFTPDGATIHGTLQAKGGEAPVVLSASDLDVTEGVLTATATGQVDRYALGVRAMPGMAARNLDVTIQIAARVVG